MGVSLECLLVDLAGLCKGNSSTIMCWVFFLLHTIHGRSELHHIIEWNTDLVPSLMWGDFIRDFFYFLFENGIKMKVS